jgi:transcription initiation factor IIE alpha subunit
MKNNTLANSIKKSKTMWTKILITTIVFGLFTVSAIQAQEKKHNESMHEHAEIKVDKPMFVCPMHPDQKSDKAGECTKCGMKMEKMEMEKSEMIKMNGTMKMNENMMSIAYMCPMKCEGEKTYANSGDCPKCGMELKEKKKEEDNDEHKH